MHQPLQERTGREDHRRRLEHLADLRSRRRAPRRPRRSAARRSPAAPADSRVRSSTRLLRARYARLVRLRARARTAGPLRVFEKSKLDSGLVDAARPISPPSASISRTRWPLPIPPIAGLHDICPIWSRLSVSISVRRTHPRRRERGLDPGMAGADNNDIVVHGEAAIMARESASRKARATTIRSRVSTIVVETNRM